MGDSAPFVAGVVVAATVGIQLIKAGAMWIGPLVLPAIFARPAPSSTTLSPAPSPTPGRQFDDEIADMRRVIDANAASVAACTLKIDATVKQLDQLSSDFARSGKRVDELAADVRAAKEALVEARLTLAQIGVRAEERERARVEQLQAAATRGGARP